jgi:carotenoid cleavage dioxygenase-like enzyme
VAPRDGEMRTTWSPTGAATPSLVHTHRMGGSVVVFALTPSLERWILDPDGSGIDREVLDATPRRCAHVGDRDADGAPRWVWTSGRESIARHDLIESHHVHVDLRPGRPGDIVVAPVEHTASIDRGWLIGPVHDLSAMTTDLWVRATNDITSVAAVVHVPRPIPLGLRCTWMPATSNDPSPTPTPREDQP